MSRLSFASIVVIGAVVLSGCTGTVEPQPEPDGPPRATLADPLPLDRLADFSGVAAMNAGSNCTGTLIDTGVLHGPAYVLTNGHCVGRVGEPAQETVLGQDWWGTAEFFRAAGNLRSTYVVDVIELAYTTMRATDTAIVRLDATLGDLVEVGVEPVPITEEEPESGQDVVNVGVPVQDLLEEDWVMRLGECTVDAQHTLIEFFWLWYDAWSNDCPGIVQGSSGSPLFQTDDAGAPERIVGMINTTSWGASAADPAICSINRPCQVTAESVEMIEETSYAQSVAGIGRCFEATTGEFVLDADCPLPYSDIWAQDGGGPFRGGGLPDAAGRLPVVNLSGSDLGVARTALIPLGDGTGCLDPATYADAGEHDLVLTEHIWEDATLVPVDLPEDEGWYLLCAVRGDGYDKAASVIFRVDRTPPSSKPSPIIDPTEDGVLVRPDLSDPDFSGGRFAWGPEGTVDCSDPAGFEDFFFAPLHIPGDRLPATYCLYSMDLAGNTTGVTEVVIPAR